MAGVRVTPFWKQCFVTSAVCFNIIGHGALLGFPGILLPQLRREDSDIQITQSHNSWITSVHSFSLLVGNFITPTISERLGRRVAHYAVTLPVIAGWMLITLASSVEMLILARILQGLSLGMLLPLRSCLIGEYTSPGNRGAFLTTVSLAQGFGVFFVHLVGTMLTWSQTALVCAFFSFASLVMTMYSPESPSYLASKGRFEECQAAFHWLRGEEEEDELEEMIKACHIMQRKKIGEKTNKKSPSAGETLRKREFYIPLIIMVHAYFMNQFAGGTLMASYSTDIIKDLMGPDTKADFWMVQLDIQRIISNTAAVFVINKVKRRTMLFTIGTLCVCSYITLAGFAYTKGGGMFYDVPWVPIVLINVQVFTVAVGMVPLPSVIAGEVFPLEYRSIGNSLSVVSLAISMFVLLNTFPFLLLNIGLYGSFALYAGILTYCLCVIYALLPETKGKTLQQIEDELRGKPLPPDELEARRSLQSDPVVAFKRKQSMMSFGSQMIQ